MKQIKLQKIFLMMSIMVFGIGYCQESINAGGGDIDSQEGSIAYSIGQTNYITHTDGNASVAEGVQQAFEIYTLSIEEPTKDISMSVYPNPTSHDVFLTIGNYQQEEMNYQIYDLNGKKVGQGEITAQETNINMSDFSSATYLIYVLDQDNNTNQTFKIIKK